MKKINVKAMLALLVVCVMAFGLVVSAADGPETYKLYFAYLNNAGSMVSATVPAGQSLQEAGVTIPPVLGLDKDGKPATNWWSSTDEEWVDENYIPKGGKEDTKKSSISIAPRHVHSTVEIPGTKATCIASGTSVSYVCTGDGLSCGEILTPAQVIPIDKDAHVYSEQWEFDENNHWHACSLCGDENAITGVAAHVPDRDEPTETEDQKCSVCGKVMKTATGHQCSMHTQKVDEVAPTCGKEGTKAYYVCGEHDKPLYYWDKDATQQITDMNDLVIPATGEHKNIVEIPGVAATCTKDGYTSNYVCEDCDAIVTPSSVIPALKHDYGEDDGHYNKYNETSHWKECERPDCDAADKGRTEAKAHTIVNQRCTECDYVLCQNHELVYVSEEAATCEKTGVKAHYTCKSCNCCYEDALGLHETTMEDLIIPMKAHSYDEEKWESDDTSHWHVCTECNKAVTGTAVHVPDRDKPTETQDQKCSVCGKVLQPSTGHKCSMHLEPWGGDAPTCATPGSLSCYVCKSHTPNKYYEDDKAEREITDLTKLIIPATGKHTIVEVAPIPATCTKAGVATGEVCTVCNISTPGAVIPALGHDYSGGWLSDEKGHWKECQRAGCDDVNKGRTERIAHNMKDGVCTECGYRQCKTHNLVIVQRMEPTCTAAGCEAYYKCESCGRCYSDAAGLKDITNNMNSISIAPKGHTEEVVSGTAATCTEEGKSEGVRCSVCGTVIKAQETIPAKGHTEEIIKGTAATCTEEGKSEGIRCSDCGTVIKEQETIPAKGHTEEIIKGTAATCTEEGKSEGIRCSDCGVIIKEQETIPAKGHTEVIVSGTAATCTEEGKSEGIRCSDCGTVIKEQETIPALGHDYSDAWSNDADKHWHACNRCGSRKDEAAHTLGAEATEENAQVCTVCGYVINPPIGHKHELQLVEAVAADCTKSGLKEHYVCSGCGKLFSDADGKSEVTLEELTIPATGANGEHTFGEWKVTKEPTETETGLRERTCSGCGYVEVEIIPALEKVTEPPKDKDDEKTTKSPQPTEGTKITNNNHESVPQQTGSATQSSSEAKKVKSPQTGDNQGIRLWMILIPICGMVIIISTAKRKKVD